METVYVTGLPEKTSPANLKTQLFDLFSPFGVIIDVVLEKTLKKKGQAFIVFTSSQDATHAIQHLQGFTFLGKPIKLDFARTTSAAYEIFTGKYNPRPTKKLASQKNPMSLQLDMNAEGLSS